MKKIQWLTILLLLLGSVGCGVTVKLNGFQEIAERHPVGMEQITENPESEALVRDLGFYINKLEQQLESKK
tara:strand:- start:4272 stop:4484 length:213 start_codon:yes stop_codon:yes gene_type:complete